MNQVLVLAELPSIQRFVFASNRLRDAVGGSQLVVEASGAAVDEAVTGLAGTTLTASAGGAVVLLPDAPAARTFTARYTSAVIRRDPTLTPVIVQRAVPPGRLAEALLAGGAELARQRWCAASSGDLLGLSVTAQCHETGGPASGVDQREPRQPLSATVLARRGRVAAATRRWRQDLLEETAQERFDFPLELELLGRTLERDSHLGLVHVDGNGTGERLNHWLGAQAGEAAPDSDVAEGFRAWSDHLSARALGTMQAVVQRVVASVETQADPPRLRGSPTQLTFTLSATKDTLWLPVRPLLLAGDDIVFACDGRIAHDLAATALDAYQTFRDAPDGQPMTACAGIAVVPLRTPFARAHAVAAALCDRAKERSRELARDGTADSALDWHVGVAPPAPDAGSLTDGATLRPYRLGGQRRSWRWLAGTVLGEAEEGLRGPLWSAARSKAKRLPELARQGAVGPALEAWQVVEPRLRLPAGSDGNPAALADALELLDLSLTLEEQAP